MKMIDRQKACRNSDISTLHRKDSWTGFLRVEALGKVAGRAKRLIGASLVSDAVVLTSKAATSTIDISVPKEALSQISGLNIYVDVVADGVDNSNFLYVPNLAPTNGTVVLVAPMCLLSYNASLPNLNPTNATLVQLGLNEGTTYKFKVATVLNSGVECGSTNFTFYMLSPPSNLEITIPTK